MKAVVIISGGLDSTVLLHKVVSEGFDVEAITFAYGQRHKKEIDMAIWQCASLGVKHYTVPLPIKELISNSALTSDKELPHEHYTHKNQQITVVPNRNMVMLSIAVALAENIRAEKVFYAAHANDKAIYPDCRPEFVQALNKAVILGTYFQPWVSAPFVHSQKTDIVLLGNKLKVDFSKTWTCYEGKDKACGKCATCQERLEAFERAKVKDPIEYEEKE
jgi:7-cyano-7-deazaguanine synthase